MPWAASRGASYRPIVDCGRRHGALLDPELELRDSNGAVMVSNNDWRDTQQAQLEATGLAPTDARESAILRTLPAGNYTAIISGRNGTTGVALVEIYNLR